MLLGGRENRSSEKWRGRKIGKQQLKTQQEREERTTANQQLEKHQRQPEEPTKQPSLEEQMIVLNEKIERELRDFEEINNTVEAIIERVREKKDNEDKVRKGVMDGSIPSAVADAGSTSNCGKLSDPYVPMGEQSDKVFHTPTGDTAAEADKRLLHHEVREPARTVDRVLSCP